MLGNENGLHPPIPLALSIFEQPNSEKTLSLELTTQPHIIINLAVNSFGVTSAEHLAEHWS